MWSCQVCENLKKFHKCCMRAYGELGGALPLFSLCLLHFLLKSATNFVGEFKILLHFLHKSATDLAPPSRWNRGKIFGDCCIFCRFPQQTSQRLSAKFPGKYSQSATEFPKKYPTLFKFTCSQIFTRPYPFPIVELGTLGRTFLL